MSSFWIRVLFDFLLAVYVLDCCFMGLVIMMQRSKQEGLGAAFGGGFTESIWGAQTSNVLVKATTVAAGLFFILSIGLARLSSASAAVDQHASTVQQELEKTLAAPAATNGAPVIVPMPSATAPTNAPAALTPASSAPTTAPTPPAPVKIPTH